MSMARAVEPVAAQTVRKKAHELLDQEHLKKYAESSDLHPQLRKVLNFFLALTPEGLLDELRHDPDPVPGSPHAPVEQVGQRGAELALVPPERRRTTGQYFLEYVQHLLEQQFGADIVFKGGLHVYTSLSPTMPSERGVLSSSFTSHSS